MVTPSSQILDVGCGSGILAVTALLLGAQRAVGVDIDELAVKVAEENARRNGVADRLSLICGDLTEKVEGVYDIICANIVADVIIRMSKDIRSFMKQGTVLLCSGIIEPREQRLWTHFPARAYAFENAAGKGMGRGCFYFAVIAGILPEILDKQVHVMVEYQ